MECKVYDENKLNTTSEEDKEYLKQTIVFHTTEIKCGNCGEDVRFAAHSCDNGVWKHVCCTCVGGRENWTEEKHLAEHQRALAVEMVLVLTAAGASAADADAHELG